MDFTKIQTKIDKRIARTDGLCGLKYAFEHTSNKVILRLSNGLMESEWRFAKLDNHMLRTDSRGADVKEVLAGIVYTKFNPETNEGASDIAYYMVSGALNNLHQSPQLPTERTKRLEWTLCR